MAEALTFRDKLRQVVPPWLRRGTAGDLLFAIGVHIDALADGLVDGVKSRFPGVYSMDSLPYLGRERRIPRGPNESNVTYADRITRWLTDHQTRGGPYAMLAQLFAYWQPNPFAIELVYISGRRFSLDTDGVVTRDDISWNGESNPAHWAQWWLFYHWPNVVPDDGLWGDAGDYGDGGVWGSGLTPAEVRDVRLVPTVWNAAHPFGTIFLLHDPDVFLWDYPVRTWDSGWTYAADGVGPARINVR
jgi:hypothetical protein